MALLQQLSSSNTLTHWRLDTKPSVKLGCVLALGSLNNGARPMRALPAHDRAKLSDTPARAAPRERVTRRQLSAENTWAQTQTQTQALAEARELK